LDGDTPGAQKLAGRFKVRGYPTMILFRPDGSELTRLPGEVDALRYMQVLAAGLAAASPIKASLATAVSDQATTLNADAWRLLAFYSWDTDEAQLVPKKELAATLRTLASHCPPEHQDAATRLDWQALAAGAKEKTTKIDTLAALQRVSSVLNDRAQSRTHFDLLLYTGDDLVNLLTRPKSVERSALVVQWNTALDQLATDASLSRSDHLSAMAAKLQLAKLGLPKVPAPKLAPALVAQARAAAMAADQETVDRLERQAIIPYAAEILSDLGLLDESDAMLKSELPKAVSPYYHMLVLSDNAEKRGDKPASLDWAERAYQASLGPATRLQWGADYVDQLIKLAPDDTARIEKATRAVIAELDPVTETFYERNQRVLDRMGARLRAWGAKGPHVATLKTLSAQLDAVCAQLPEGDPARNACAGVFKVKASSKGA
jgi:hypothetical protein